MHAVSLPATTASSSQAERRQWLAKLQAMGMGLRMNDCARPPAALMQVPSPRASRMMRSARAGSW